MILYNCTTQVLSSIEEEWINWVKKELIPKMINTSCFTQAKFLKLLNFEQEDVVTYAVQYLAENTAAIEHFENNFRDEMDLEIREKWGEQQMSFVSLLEEI